MFNLTFYGAAGQVTGSKYFLRTSKSRGFMLDCGLFQGGLELREKNWEPLPIAVSDIHNIVLTHAHLDHTGYLPKLVKQGFNGQIFCTPSTHEVASFILRDSAKIQMEDAEDANKHQYTRHHPALPLYDSDDVEQTLGQFRVVSRDSERKLPDDISFRFYNAGHILGSNFVRVTRHADEEHPADKQQIRVLFSGDLGRDKPIYLNPKDAPPAADFLICESTYGDRVHHPVAPMDEFLEVVQRVVAEKLVLVIPAFAVDRAQEIIYCLNAFMRDGKIPEIRTFVDSPMATGVTAVYEKYADEHTMLEEEMNEPDKNPLSFPSLHFVRTPTESKSLNNLSGPAIIISASGMASGGRIMHHLRNRLPDAGTLVLFTGFQAEATLGRDLIEGADAVSIHGIRIPVHARVEKLNTFSGHADQNELLEWMQQMPSAPKRVFLTHGEQPARIALKAKIEAELGWDVYLPRIGETIDLEALMQELPEEKIA
jgi:metallo-beta-lactamase family protein